MSQPTMANLRKQFSKIYDQYINKIYRFIFLKVSSQEVAEDLTSEVFIRGWDSFRQGADIKNIQAFLYQIARNLVIDHYRQKSQVKTISAEFVQMVDPRLNLEEKAKIDSELDQVKFALSNINEDYREVIIWRYLDQLSISEIAEILDKSEGAVRVALHRGLKELRNKLNTD
ncbi:MAG: hypothetical protein COZ89_02305 [Candidatus Nealsonbacteria bacterium CG_4_8_14_3_um_filter_37_23]|nr:MAG: hypothetical protein COZ89_02305 [Candidatus Nealsonbacteria bacterium CG_4_8_14_3_um_filter_37_23]